MKIIYNITRIDKTKKKKYIGVYLKISLSLNNIFITLTDRSGNVILSKHSGILGYKGSKKKNPYVAGEVINALIADLNKLNIILRYILVQVFFPVKSPFAYSIMRQLTSNKKLDIGRILKVRSIEHSLGLRKQKQRRI
jgi:small subunit ribosomal protein S11